jgi:RNA polymerase sigma-70 factor (ECF subfamily)
MTDLRADDPALERAFAARERWAFDEAYGRYAGLLYSAAYNVLHTREDAEDCVHDALLRVWKNPDAYSTERGTLRSFLAVCVRNAAISRVRTMQTRAGAQRRATVEPEAEFVEFPDVIEQSRLRAAIASLPDEQREPLLLAYYGYRTHVEIAEALATPLGTIKSRIAQAVRRLGPAMRPGTAV